MSKTTNYMKHLYSIRQFFHSLSFGNHNRATAQLKGIKDSQHDDNMACLRYFNLLDKVDSIKFGRTHVHYIPKDDFVNGYNYLNSLFELYAAVPDKIYIVFGILSLVSNGEKRSIEDIYNALIDGNLTTFSKRLSSEENGDIIANYANHYQQLLEDLKEERHHSKTANTDQSPKKKKDYFIEKQEVSRQITLLTTLGIMSAHKDSKKHLYSLVPIVLDKLTHSDLHELATAVFFYKNISITSAAGHILLKKINQLCQNHTLKEDIQNAFDDFHNHYFLFKDNNPNSAIDGDIIYPLAQAMRDHKKIALTSYLPGRKRDIVIPIQLQTHYGDNKNTLICLNQNHLQTYRLDRIKSIHIEKSSGQTVDTTTLWSTKKQDTFTIYFNHTDGYESYYKRFKAMYASSIVEAVESNTHTIFKLNIADGLQELPTLRLFLPYLQLSYCNKQSVLERFRKNMVGCVSETFTEPAVYHSKQKKNPYTSGKKNSPSPNSNDVSPIFHPFNNIVFTTLYRLQYDIINNNPYTMNDMYYVLDNRPLRAKDLPSVTAEDSRILPHDQYEKTLAESLVMYDDAYNSDDKPVNSILDDLPPIILTSAERMFLQDLLHDERANWLLSDTLRQTLSEALKDIPTTMPTDMWVNVSPTVDETPQSLDIIKTCITAIDDNHCVTIDGHTLAPYRLEYSVATNGFALIAYNCESQEFNRYPLQDAMDLLISEVLRPNNMDTMYNTFKSESERELLFTLHNTNNAIDRCFNYFSDYNIIANDTNTDDIHVIIRYLPYQESDIFDNLLKLGMAVKVQEPIDIKNRLHTIYTTAIACATQSTDFSF